MAERQDRIFYDPQGKRWRRVSRIGIITSCITSILLWVFLFTVLVYPSLPYGDRYQMILQVFSIHPETRAEAMANFLAWRAIDKAIDHEPPITQAHQHAISTVQPYKTLRRDSMSTGMRTAFPAYSNISIN